MADTVRGRYELSTTQPRSELRALRRDADLTEGSVRRLGNRLDGLVKQTAGVKRLRTEFRGLAKDAVLAEKQVGRAMSEKTKAVERQIAAVGLLRKELKGLGRERASADVEVRGVASSILEVKALIRQLKELDRIHATATARVRSRGGGGAGGLLGGGGAAGDAGAGAADNAERSFQRAGRSAQLFGHSIGMIAGAASLALPAITSLTGAVGALVGSLGAGALGAGALGISGLGALGVGIGGLVSIGKPAVTAVGNVLKAQQTLRQNQKQQVLQNRLTGASTVQLQQNQQALTNAQFQATQAQQALTQARRDAVRAITDLRLANERASLSEQQALLSQRQARMQLARTLADPTASATAIQEARLGLTGANLDVESARIDRGRAGVDFRRARARGVAGAQSVVQARQGVVTSRQAVQSARRTVALGSSGAQQSALDRGLVAQMLAKAPPGTKELLSEARSFSTSWRVATREAQGNLVSFATMGVRTGKALESTLVSSATRSSAALLREGKKFGSFLRSGLVRSFIRDSTAEFDENLGDARRTGQSLITVLMQISRAARPYVREVFQGLRRMTGEWAAHDRDTLKLRDRIGGLVTQTRKWFDLARSTFLLLRDLVSPGVGAGGGMVSSLTRTFDRWDLWARRNPEKLREFFRNAVSSTERMASALAKVVAALFRVGQQLQPVLSGFTTLLSLVSPLAGSLPGLGGAYGAYRAGSFLMGRGGSGGRGGGGGGGPTVVPIGGAGGSGLLRGGAAVEGAELGGGALAFKRIYGGVKGARYASTATVASRAYGLGRLGGVAGRLGGAAGAAGRALAPIVLLQGGLTALSGQNPLASGSTLGATAKGAMYGAALGSVVPVLGTAVGGAVGAAVGGVSHILGGGKNALPTSVTDRFQAQINRRMAAGDYDGAIRSAHAMKRLSFDMSGGDQRRVSQAADSIIKDAQAAKRAVLQGRGSAAAQDVITATRRRTAQYGTAGGRREFSVDFQSEFRKATGAGKLALAQGVGDWIRTLEGGNKKQKALAHDMALTIQRTYANMGQTVSVVNGRILTGSDKEWAQIAGVISSHATQALSSTSAAFRSIQAQAVGSLHSMGFSMSDARGLTRTMLGGGSGSSQASQIAKSGGSFLAKDSSGTPIAPSSGALQSPRARGGRLPGRGLADTVRMSDGGYGAPGELVLSRHQEADADRDLAAAGKPRLAHRLVRVRTPHSAPMRATGGRVDSAAQRGAASGVNFGGHPSNVSAPISRLIGFMERRWPKLSVTSTTDHSYRSTSGGVSFHSSGRAVDMAADPAYMNRVAGWINSSGFYKKLTEGIHNPNLSVKYGKHVPASFWGPAVWAQHLNHIHMALAGGLGSTANLGRGAGGTGRVHLRAPRSNLAGIPGALRNAAASMYAAGLQKRINRHLNAVGAPSGGGGDISDISLGRAGGGTRWGATMFGGPSDPGTGHIGYRGDDLNLHPDSFAELDMGKAMGGLPYMARVKVSYGGKSAVLRKRDIGLGGGPINGVHRGIDLWYKAAAALGLNGSGVVDVQRLARGGRVGPDFGGWFRNGGAATFRRPAVIGVGDGQPSGGSETVSVSRNRPGSRPGGPGHSLHLEMKFGDVHVRDEREFREWAERAADRAGEKLLAALEGSVDS